MLTRKDFLKYLGATAGAALLAPGLNWPRAAYAGWRVLLAHAAPAGPVPGGTLDPNSIPKYVTSLRILPAMPLSPTTPPGLTRAPDYYDIEARQFQQQILPPSLPPTTVWGYGLAADPTTLSYPAYTIEAQCDHMVWIRWINGLLDNNGGYLPHLFAVDPTLHWANPPGGKTGRDSRPTFTSTPGPYIGPVPLVTHVHGSHTGPENDGYPEAWTLPAANNIPAGYAATGSFYDIFREISHYRLFWTPGSAVAFYPNDQRATTLWYHDHTVGLTRLSVYAGLAGFYILRGGPADLPPGVLPGPAPARYDPPNIQYYELPLVIQDRSFNADGSLFYPATRAFFDNIGGPYIPGSDVSPIWNPGTFGNTMVANGRTWPALQVEARRYRFRILNACNLRTLILQVAAAPAADPATIPPAAMPLYLIGTDGGFLPAVVTQDRLIMAPAERVDVILDFTGLAGSQLFLLNLGPDAMFHGGAPGTDFPLADPGTTGQVLRFNVVASAGDPSTPVTNLQLPALTPLGPANLTRRVSLGGQPSTYPAFNAAMAQMLLGTVTLTAGTPVRTPAMWSDPPTEMPDWGATEIWEIYNFDSEAHPIHLHPVQFQVVNRQPFPTGAARPPEPRETGFKDTVIAYPFEITRIKAHFDLAGRYVWHCHMLEHEDNEMMRPLIVSHKLYYPWLPVG